LLLLVCPYFVHYSLLLVFRETAADGVLIHITCTLGYKSVLVGATTYKFLFLFFPRQCDSLNEFYAHRISLYILRIYEISLFGIEHEKQFYYSLTHLVLQTTESLCVMGQINGEDLWGQEPSRKHFTALMVRSLSYSNCALRQLLSTHDLHDLWFPRHRLPLPHFLIKTTRPAKIPPNHHCLLPSTSTSKTT
jgi:hypothetical protein